MSGGFFTPPKSFGSQQQANVPTTNTGFNFGAPTTNTGFSFAPPAQSNTNSAFNFNTPALQTQPTNTAAPVQSGGFNFNIPTTSNSVSGFGGTNLTAATTTTPFTLGNASTLNSQSNFGGLTASSNVPLPQFGLAVTSSTVAGLGNTSLNTTASSLVATTANSVPGFTGLSTPGLNLTSTGFAAPNAKTPGFNFGSTVPTLTGTTTSTLNFGTSTGTAPINAFGVTATSATSGMFGNKATTSQSLLPLNSTLFNNQLSTVPGQLPLTAITSGPAPSLGLGGSDLNSNQPKSSVGITDNIKVKDILIPAPIAETIENMKTYIKQQKIASSDIARATIRKIKKVEDDTKCLQNSLQEISNCVGKHFRNIKLLRKETCTILQTVEMAQRTLETSVGLQFENTMPLNYFQELVNKYELDLLAFRHQVELTEKHIGSLSNPQSFTPEDLKRGLKQIHESFIALAGRLHDIHQKVETHKEHYLNLRKYYLHDSQNVFAELDTKPNDLGVSNISSGPTPFSSLSAAANASWQNKSNANRNLGAFNSGSIGQNLMTSQDHNLIGNVNTAKPFFSTANFGNIAGAGFNLQTPPMGGGAKRNKQ